MILERVFVFVLVMSAIDLMERKTIYMTYTIARPHSFNLDDQMLP